MCQDVASLVITLLVYYVVSGLLLAQSITLAGQWQMHAVC